jgi:hypothetical protein
MKIDRVGRQMTFGQGMLRVARGSIRPIVGQPMIRISSMNVGGRVTARESGVIIGASGAGKTGRALKRRRFTVKRASVLLSMFLRGRLRIYRVNASFGMGFRGLYQGKMGYAFSELPTMRP